MSDREYLLAAIAAHYYEHTPRLEYADWLQDHGTTDLDRATEEFIRVSCDMINSPFMPPKAYYWIECNWPRLVPSLVALNQDALSKKRIWHREGRTIYFRPHLPYPFSRSKSGTRPCPMRLDFHLGFLGKVTLWSSYALGYTAAAFAADQPGALANAHGSIDGVYGRPFGVIMADPELRARINSLCSFLGSPTHSQPEAV